MTREIVLATGEREHPQMDMFNAGHDLPNDGTAFSVRTIGNEEYPSCGDVQWLNGKDADALAWKFYNAGHDVVVVDASGLRYIDIRQSYD